MGWLFLILIVGAALFLVLRSRSKAAAAPPKPRYKYEGLAFEAEQHCCTAARYMNGRRYLIAEAPKVPLADCTDPALCKCKLRHIKDRRSGDDRRTVVGALSTEMPIGDERSNKRTGRDRRKEDISFDI